VEHPKLAVFGSYLRADVAELGDLDLADKFHRTALRRRRPRDRVACAEASGRNFPTLFATIAWAQMELLQLLRNRGGYINVHTEDITRFTDDWRVVYSHPSAEVSAAG
jgi:hypothetical protein